MVFQNGVDLRPKSKGWGSGLEYEDTRTAGTDTACRPGISGSAGKDRDGGTGVWSPATCRSHRRATGSQHYAGKRCFKPPGERRGGGQTPLPELVRARFRAPGNQESVRTESGPGMLQRTAGVQADHPGGVGCPARTPGQRRSRAETRAHGRIPGLQPGLARGYYAGGEELPANVREWSRSHCRSRCSPRRRFVSPGAPPGRCGSMPG